MRIPAGEVAYRRTVGRLRGRSVMQVGSIGGIHVIAAEDNGEVLGAGVHPALARHAARTQAPGLEFTDLAKAEPLDARTLADMLPAAVSLTAALRARQGHKG